MLRGRTSLAFMTVFAGLGAAFGLVVYLTTGPTIAKVVDEGEVVALAPVRTKRLAVTQRRSESQATRRLEFESAATEPADIAIRVMSKQGLAIVGAEVSVLSTDELLHQESTPESGRVIVPHPALDRILVTVSSSEYAYSQQWLTTPYPRELEIRLAPGSAVSGTVRLAGGAVPYFPVRVFAWPSGPEPPQGAFGSRPSLPWSKVDTEGRFKILGLDPSTHYTLAAGALGWVTHLRAQQVSVDANDVDLILWRAFACVFHVRDYSGNPLPKSAFARIVSTLSPVPSSKEIYSGNVDRVLAGLGSIVKMPGLSDWRNGVMAYKAADPSAALGSVDVLFEVPGFETATASIPFFPVERTIAARTILLSRTARGFGHIRIRLISDENPLPKLALGGPHTSVVKFIPMEDEAKELVVGYYGLDKTDRDIEGVPFGEYHVEFISAGGAYRDPSPKEPPRTVFIGPTPVEIKFDVRRLCTAAVQFPTLGRHSSRPNLIIEARRAGNKRAASYFFDKPPYMLQGLPPGPYRLTLRRGGVKSFLAVELQGSGVQHIAWPASKDE